MPLLKVLLPLIESFPSRFPSLPSMHGAQGPPLQVLSGSSLDWEVPGAPDLEWEPHL